MNAFSTLNGEHWRLSQTYEEMDHGMPFSCERCAAVNIDAAWRWCPECGAIPPRTDLLDLDFWIDDELGQWRVGASNLF